jgi:chromosomal replication initiator protein
MAILQAKAEERSALVPNDVLMFIAESVESNIRELEGALTRLLAVARMMGLPLSIQTAEKALGTAIHAPAQVTIEQIMDVVASHFGLRVDDLIGPRRTRAIARPRQVCMFLARELTDMSLPRIGEALGGRDHTTIMHGCDKIGALFEKDDEMRRHVLSLKTALASGRRTVGMAQGNAL